MQPGSNKAHQPLQFQHLANLPTSELCEYLNEKTKELISINAKKGDKHALKVLQLEVETLQALIRAKRLSGHIGKTFG